LASAGVVRAFAPRSGVALDVRPSPAGARAVLRLRADGPEIELNRALTACVAHALWEQRGGGSETNWADAEAAIAQLLSRVLDAASTPAVEVKPGSGAPARR
jgi:hypothetical protein